MAWLWLTPSTQCCWSCYILLLKQQSTRANNTPQAISQEQQERRSCFQLVVSLICYSLEDCGAWVWVWREASGESIVYNHIDTAPCIAKQHRGSDFARTTRVLNLLPTCSLTHLLFARGLQASGFEYDELHLSESISFWFYCVFSLRRYRCMLLFNSLQTIWRDSWEMMCFKASSALPWLPCTRCTGGPWIHRLHLECVNRGDSIVTLLHCPCRCLSLQLQCTQFQQLSCDPS
jgi:hypothetical protein